MADVFIITHGKDSTGADVTGCLIPAFEVPHAGEGYPRAVKNHHHTHGFAPGSYLILEATSHQTTGMVFTIEDDGTFKQGFPASSVAKITRWPPKS